MTASCQSAVELRSCSVSHSCAPACHGLKVKTPMQLHACAWFLRHRSQNHALHVGTEVGPPAAQELLSVPIHERAKRQCRALRRAVGTRWIVGRAADVVLGIQLWVLSILGVGVHHVDVHGEACIHEVNMLAPVGRWHSPSVAVPGVGNLLVPAVVEDAAAPVMVAQNTQPGLAIQAGSIVDALKDLVELVVGHVRDLIHGCAAGLLNATPIEVVTHIQNELWISFCSSLLERACHQLLGLVVEALDKATARVAHASHSLVALNEP